MATNLHAMMRYRVIDRCLRKTGEVWDWKTLAEACGKMLKEQYGLDTIPSERTIKEDLRNMRSGDLGYRAPIKYNRALKSYAYTDNSFAINDHPITDTQLGDIKNALNILRQFSGNENLKEMQEILVELEYTLAIKEKDAPPTIIHIDESLNVLKKQWLGELLKHINDKQPLRIQYQSFYKDKKWYVVSPYFLKKYNGRWNLIGHSLEHDAARTFPLDRIHDLKISLKDYVPNQGIDAKTYFKDMIGISKNSASQQVRKVVFKAYGLNRFYMHSKPIHHTQICLDDSQEEYWTFQIEVIPNYELEMELLARCDEVEIVKPVALKRRLKERVERFLELNRE